jgi:hypothetical protein
MTQSKHTPTPWKVCTLHHSPNRPWIEDNDGNVVDIFDNLNPEQAAFIVKAVNCLDMLIREFQNLLETAIVRGNLKEGEDLVRSARHALAKAGAA